jgi:peptide/nickel transport system permease protein
MRLYRIKEIFVTQIKIITRHRFGTFGAVVLLFFALVGLLAPYITPHDPWDSLRGADGKLAMPTENWRCSDRRVGSFRWAPP